MVLEEGIFPLSWEKLLFAVDDNLYGDEMAYVQRVRDSKVLSSKQNTPSSQGSGVTVQEGTWRL